MASHDEVERLREDVVRLRSEVESERRHAMQWRQVAEERRLALERLRSHPAVRVLLWLARALLPGARRLRRRAGRVGRTLKGVGAMVAGLRHRLTAGGRERRLEGSLSRLPPPPSDPRTVSVIIPTRDGGDHLARLLSALRSSDHDRLQIIVFDNGSDDRTAAFLNSQEGIEVVRSETNQSFSAANNRAAEIATGDVLCFLNDDVEPLGDAWLPRMLAALHDDVVAVGAQLVYPRRSLLARTRTRDVGTQHRGIVFDPVPGGVPQARNLGGGADPDVSGDPFEVPAATAACLAIDRDAFGSVGGFDERYVYGAEDVDLCWRLRRDGGRVMVAPDAVLAHHEGSTRHREVPAVLRERQERNWDRLAERFGPEITRAVAKDRLHGELLLSHQPYRIAITVTRDREEAGYGDHYTAHELGDALGELGIDVVYVERHGDAYYDIPPDVDAVLALLDAFDVRRVVRPGLVTIAWVRNWTERWVSSPWFEHFDVVLAASERSAATIRERSRHRAVVFPLATNPDRFSPDARSLREKVVFTGNHWGTDDRASDLVRAVDGLEVHGRGWESVPEVAPRWKGHRSYDELPALYRDSLVVVDRAGVHTRDEGSVNSRVFDALACGALPVTDQVEGAREIFGENLPTYTTPDDLADLVGDLRARPDAAVERAQELRDIVLRDHTYALRARRLRDLLAARIDTPSFVLKVSAPNRRVAGTWGDWHLAEALGKELGVRGHDVRLQTADEWEDRDGRAYDIAMHLRGRSRPRAVEGQLHVIWNISHPEELTVEECDEADLVLVASRTFVEEMRARTSTPVHALLQATDEHRFNPRASVPEHRHDIAFVGNSRFVERPIVADALAVGLRPAVYGANWERFIDPDLVVSEHVANERLPVVYSSVKVLLNDHWEGMRRYGFISNRIFDALACGTCVVSDHHDELEALFGDVVVTYRSADELRRVVTELLGDDTRRAELGERGRRQVLAAHTIRHRVDELLHHLQDDGGDRMGTPRG